MSQPRTRHLNPMGQALFTNRLAQETSPYLLQHAHNPVDWFPWGQEALELAKAKNRPIFLSIGYSTCHWCHVMEEESFEDLEIAEFLKAHFVSIKVDREERPDLDSVFMAAVQGLTGRGGWPMSVWLLPNAEPFFGGTYFPARDGDRGSSTGFLTLLKNIEELFRTSPEKLLSNAKALGQFLKENLSPDYSGESLSTELFDRAFSQITANYDETYGGRRGAPKFPSSFPIRLALRMGKTHPAASDMALQTLEKMALGGIYDQVGGGFHRYSTDEKWLVPHFEKMLYDNALLAVAYTEAYQFSGETFYRDIAEDILNYVARDMRAEGAAFYSATDADSLGPSGKMEEGYFFSWSQDELQSLLPKESLLELEKIFVITDEGNFEGRHILERRSRSLRLDEELRSSLLNARSQRAAPLRDEKILVSWNALMISAFAKAARVFSSKRYLDIAVAAASFIRDNMYESKHLTRVYTRKEAKPRAFLEDYAFLIQALLDLFETTNSALWLDWALELDGTLAQEYEDKENGAFFVSSKLSRELLYREKPLRDGAEPSGNSVMALNLERFYLLTNQKEYRERADRLLDSVAKLVNAQPLALSELLLAWKFRSMAPKLVIIVHPQNGANPDFATAFERSFPTHAQKVEIAEGDDEKSRWIPALRGKVALEGKSTAYVCVEGECQLPITDPKALRL